MKKIRFIITFIYFALIALVVVLTVLAVFRATTELTGLYFKNLESEGEARTMNFTINDIERIINILQAYKLI